MAYYRSSSKKKKGSRNSNQYHSKPRTWLEYWELLDIINDSEANLTLLKKEKVLRYKEKLETDIIYIQQISRQLEHMDSEYDRAKLKLDSSLAELKVLQERAEREKLSASLLMRFIGSKGVTQETQISLRKAEANSSTLRTELESYERIRNLGPTGYRELPLKLRDSRSQLDYIQDAAKMIKSLEKAAINIEKLTAEKETKRQEAAILKANRLAITAQIRKDRADTERAHAAAHREKTRDLADSIKRKLPRNHPCPYCGGLLGHEPHADHIHPVSQGGLSTVANMVYACNKCNGNKTDLTIKQFTIKYDLDRNTIEDRLEALGKRI